MIQSGSMEQAPQRPKILLPAAPDELVLMLERAGFGDLRVRGRYNDAEPTVDDDFLVYIARRAA